MEKGAKSTLIGVRRELDILSYGGLIQLVRSYVVSATSIQNTSTKHDVKHHT